MKNTKNILAQIEKVEVKGTMPETFNAMHIDSRNCAIGDMFFAIKGTQVDGHQFISKAIENGAKIIVCEEEPNELVDKVAYVMVQNVSVACGRIASAYYNHPSDSLKLVGITGTNGKSTCVTLLYQLFVRLGLKVGLLSTIENRIGNEVVPSTHTTPNQIELHKLLADMVSKGCAYAFMEVSSHAIDQNRIAGARFAGALFTNISHDHLDYHKTFDAYITAKKAFFDRLSPNAFAITNADDKRGGVMLQNTKALKKSFSIKTAANYKGKILENNLSGLIMLIDGKEVYLKLIGTFNAYNILSVYSIAVELGFEPVDVLQHISALQGAEGRFETIQSTKEKVLGIVDYAHTPDALINVLATINKLRNGNETVHSIVGCGGDRDKTKRPLMANVACEYSDKVIFTSDNPRTENPEAIIQEMEQGVAAHLRKKYLSITNRREAIKTACSLAKGGDIILVAGKGHEKYQEIDGVKYDFDDKQILEEFFELMEK